MNWISKNVEKVVVFAAAAILLVVAIMIGLSAMNFEERPEFTEVQAPLNGTAPKSDKIDPLNIEALNNANKAMMEPATWENRTVPLFKSQSYIVKKAGGVEELQKTDIGEFHLPVTNAYINKYGLPIDDERLKYRDYDQDGFTVLEEFLANSNPVDDTSYPALWAKLRLRDYEEIPFRIQFTSRSGPTVFVETLDVENSPTQFLTEGEDVEGTNYRVKEIIEKSAPHPELDYEQDVSVVVFEEKTSGKTIRAKRGEIADDPDSFIVLVSLLDQKEWKLKLGETFAMPQEPETDYKVIDMSKAEAVIENVDTQEKKAIKPENS